VEKLCATSESSGHQLYLLLTNGSTGRKPDIGRATRRTLKNVKLAEELALGQLNAPLS